MNDYSIKMVSFCTLNLEKWLKIRLFRTSFLIPTRCRDLHLKQFCLEDIAPAVLTILITHIILAVRWMLIKILSAVINGQRSHKVIVPGGCYLDIIIIRKIDQKSRCYGTFDVRILPDRLETPAGMAGALLSFQT